MQQLRNAKELETDVKRRSQIVSRKKNVVIMSMEEFRKEMKEKEIIKKLKKVEEEIDNQEGIDLDTAFKELKKKYEY